MKNNNIVKDEEQTSPSQFPSSEKLENLLRSRYEEEVSRKEYLDEKANNTMGIASTVATLYGGLGIVAATDLFSKFEINVSVVVLLAGLSLLIASIIISAKSYLLREYEYILRPDYFVTMSKDGFTYKNKEIDKYRNLNPNELSRLLVRNYGKCIIKNFKVNDRKANELGWGQKIFLIGVASVPLFALLSVLH